MTARSVLVSVRFSAAEKALLDAITSESRGSLSDFIRRAVIQEAEMQQMERRTIAISAEAWDRVEEWLAAPQTATDALQRAMKQTPPWAR